MLAKEKRDGTTRGLDDLTKVLSGCRPAVRCRPSHRGVVGGCSGALGRRAERPPGGALEGGRAFADKIVEWIDRSGGRVPADVVHEKLVAMGYSGSERTTRRVVAAEKGSTQSTITTGVATSRGSQSPGA